MAALYGLLLGDWFHRACVALGLAAALVISGTVSLSSAFHSIDWNTIFLLAGMMVCVACLGDAGLFSYLGRRAKHYARGKPWRLLWIFYVLTAVISAFLDNVTTILLLAPILIEAAEEMDLDPIPLLMVQVIASNLGGVATLVGDPPNILIGTAAHLSFLQFAKNLGPIAVLMLAFLALLLPGLIRLNPHLKSSGKPGPRSDGAPVSPKLKGLLAIVGLMLAAFLLPGQIGVGVGYIALAGALLSTAYAGALRSRWYRHVDYGTLAFFIGVFVLVGGIESSGLVHYVVLWLSRPSLGPWLPLLLFLGTAVFSALLDNVPLVAALIPVLERMAGAGSHFGVELWIAIGLGAAVGGNATIIGASANVVAQGLAIERGYALSFAKFARFGMKAAGLTALVGAAYLTVRF
jgi:Na+/H+ antiporter NhaD/arsenite permease-like protein